MTDEERQRLCANLRSGFIRWFMKAADEIERLASELKREEAENEHYIRLVFVDAGANPPVTWKGEAERLAKELKELKATFRAAAIELGDPRTRQQHPERQRKF